MTPSRPRSFAALRPVVLVVVAIAALAGVVLPAGAAQFAQPASDPIAVHNDASGTPEPFTVVVTGFPAPRAVLEVCDGASPTDPAWKPTLHCDPGASGALVAVDADGRATFPAGDRNHEVRIFHGASPSGMFNCLAPGEADPKNGLQSFTNCQLRVSTTNAAVTPDQVFRTFVLGTGPNATGATAATTAKSSGSGSHTVLWIFVGAGLVVVAMALVVAARRRRAAH